MKQKIVFFGSGWYTIPVIKKLLPYRLELVVTTEKNPNSPLLRFCSENNIQYGDISTLKSQLSTHTVGVLASFGAIIPQSIISVFPNGIINIHPSLLPKYKGPSPIQYQLLNGETTVGVTLIKLDDHVDHGPILSQKPYNLMGNETSEDLLSILFEIGSDMVKEIVIKLENGETITQTPQDHAKESWSYKITKQDGYIDIENLSATNYQISAMVHAFYPWPGVWFVANLKGQEKIVKLLPDNKIQVEGKSPMSYKDFINGFGQEGKVLLEKLQLN